MLRRIQSIFDQTHWHDHDDDFDYKYDHDFDHDRDDDDDFYHDDIDNAGYLKSMHHPPERMKGQAIKGIPSSSEKAQKPNDHERKSFWNLSEGFNHCQE